VRHPLLPIALASGLALTGLVGLAGPAQAVSVDVVISEVYGGGGNNSAPFNQDFIELENRSSVPVSVDGWSVQYASSTGTGYATNMTRLTGSVPAGGRYLIGGAKGTTGADLPATQVTGSINLSGTTGKVALVENATGLSCGTDCDHAAGVHDFVGYGSANDFEGAAAAPSLTNSTSATRIATADTDQNGADFTAAAPTPDGSAAEPPTDPPPVDPPTPTACTELMPTPIPRIQGSTDTSPLAGQKVTTRGVVVADTSGLSGFFLQDPTGDGNPDTSDGVFVYVPAANPQSKVDVAVGDTVAVSATVKEFNGLTELDPVTVVEVCAPGTSLPPTAYELPEPEQGDLERVEGMLVNIPTELTVQQNFFLGRYGQLTLGSGGRLFTPTNVARPGSDEAKRRAAANARALLVLDDASSAQNPNPVPYLDEQGTRRAGDTTSDLTGVIDFGPINSDAKIRDYRLQPTQAPEFTSSGRPQKPEDVGGTLRAASFNVLNYFTTLDDGSNDDARGANSAEEFRRQREKIFAALRGLDADVVGLIEIENNDEAAQDLVDGLNASYGDTPGTWAVVPDPANGVGTDAIKVAQIYRTDRVARVGASLSPADQSAFDGVGRPPVAQAYRQLAGGGVASLVINHFKSKGSCPSTAGPDSDSGDGQGCFNATRVEQAGALLDFVGAVQKATDDGDALVVGDLNAYGEEDPIQVLEDGGLVNLIQREIGERAYSYVFDGQSGYLDHALGTVSLAEQVTGVTEWHINADEPSIIDYNTEYKPDDRYAPTPYRSSDHDPVLVGLELEPAPAVSVGPARATEGGELSFPLTLSRASDEQTSVQVRTVDGSATAGRDYPAVDRRVTIPAGETSATVQVPTTQDRLDETDETLALRLSEPSGLQIGNGDGPGTIVDDDTARASVGDDTVREGAPGARPVLEFPVTLSTASTRAVSVGYETRNGSARAGSDYRATSGRLVIPAGSRRGVVRVTVLGDRAREGNETMTLALRGKVADALGKGVLLNDD